MRKSSDAGSSDVPKKSCKVLFSSERVKVLDLIRKGKNILYIGFSTIHGLGTEGLET